MVTWFNFGEFVESSEINADIMQEILKTAQSKVALMRDRPVVKLATVLDRVGQRLADPDDPVRQQVMAIMPAQISFSTEMIAAGLGAICEILKFDNLITRLAVDIDDVAYIDTFTWHDRFRGDP